MYANHIRRMCVDEIKKNITQRACSLQRLNERKPDEQTKFSSLQG